MVDGGKGGSGRQVDPHSVIGVVNGGFSGSDPMELVNEAVTLIPLLALRGGDGRGHMCGSDRRRGLRGR